jgi:hypothetical protein
VGCPGAVRVEAQALQVRQQEAPDLSRKCRKAGLISLEGPIGINPSLTLSPTLPEFSPVKIVIALEKRIKTS